MENRNQLNNNNIQSEGRENLLQPGEVVYDVNSTGLSKLEFSELIRLNTRLQIMQDRVKREIRKRIQR